MTSLHFHDRYRSAIKDDEVRLDTRGPPIRNEDTRTCLFELAAGEAFAPATGCSVE
jgi:hypothetical protein